MMKIAKKVLAIVMAVSMLLSTASTVLANGTEGNASIKDSSISDLMNANDINPLTGNETEPFNAAPGSSILMTKENELLLYTSNKKGVSAKDDFVTVFEKMTQSTSYTGESNVSPELDLFFVTAVALNTEKREKSIRRSACGVYNGRRLCYNDKMQEGRGSGVHIGQCIFSGQIWLQSI